MNLAIVEIHNQEADNGKNSYWLAINEFADMVNILYLKKYF